MIKSAADTSSTDSVDFAGIPLPKITLSSFDFRAASLARELLPAFPVYLISSYSLSPTIQPVTDKATSLQLHGLVLETKQVCIFELSEPLIFFYLTELHNLQLYRYLAISPTLGNKCSHTS